MIVKPGKEEPLITSSRPITLLSTLTRLFEEIVEIDNFKIIPNHLIPII